MPLNIFESTRRTEISLWLFLSDLLFCLCMGVTLASFHAVGNVPQAIQMFISLASDGAIAGAAIFSMRALMPSTPVALPDGFLVWFGVIVGKAFLTSEVLCLLTKDFRVFELN